MFLLKGQQGTLFTCLTTRAVHFEVVPSMDTSSCVMGIERLIARRDTPSVVWSDNGTNLIQRKFNPPTAPHHRGVWERFVRSFKHVFYAILGNRRLTDEILATTFCSVEQSPNFRPRVPVSSDATMPSHQRADIDHRKRYVRAQAYSHASWERWLREYVPLLNCRSKWSTTSERDLIAGDLVWIVEPPTSPRGPYPLAPVIKLNYGPDSVARSAELETTKGNCFDPSPNLHPFSGLLIPRIVNNLK